MAEKKKKQDVLKDILGSSQDDSVPGLEELSQLIHPRGKPPSIASASKTTARRKKKTTHYLSEEIFENLGEAKERIQDLIPGGERIRISKSGIVNSALKMILREFEAKGEKSLLVRHMMKAAKKVDT
jgi:hypothetical protein